MTSFYKLYKTNDEDISSTNVDFRPLHKDLHDY